MLTSFLPTISLILNLAAIPHIYTLSLHDALPIFERADRDAARRDDHVADLGRLEQAGAELVAHVGHDAEIDDLGIDRKSTRLNSSHVRISYAVFCLKKKHSAQRSATGAAMAALSR